MKNNKKKQLDLTLILPAVMLLLIVFVVIFLVVGGYQLNPLIVFFFVLLSLFLIFQISRQLMTQWQVKQAIKKIEEADSLVKSGQPMEAVKLWKNLLLSLPRDQYLVVLSKMEETYQNQGMETAVEQVRAIHSKSIEFFKMVKSFKKFTLKDRQEWQTQAMELRNMVKALPEKADQSLTDARHEE